MPRSTLEIAGESVGNALADHEANNKHGSAMK